MSIALGGPQVLLRIYQIGLAQRAQWSAPNCWTIGWTGPMDWSDPFLRTGSPAGRTTIAIVHRSIFNEDLLIFYWFLPRLTEFSPSPIICKLSSQGENLKERVFSGAKHTIADQRASLKSETVELLECLKSWFGAGIFTEEIDMLLLVPWRREL